MVFFYAAAAAINDSLIFRNVKGSDEGGGTHTHTHRMCCINASICLDQKECVLCQQRQETVGGGGGGFYTFNKVGVRKERGSENEVMV